MKEEKYEEALANLKDVKNGELETEKNALLIIINFRLGNGKDAVSMTDKFLNKKEHSEYDETVIKENMLYFYNNNNEKEFKKFAKLLKKYYGNTILINYLYAKFFYNNNEYKTSYYYFLRIADIESEYRDEAIYHLGLISLNNRNSKLALYYFKKISLENNMNSQFAMRGKIDLSILSNETGDVELSKKMLTDILNNSDNRLLRIQAENLADYFGYKDETQTDEHGAELNE